MKRSWRLLGVLVVALALVPAARAQRRGEDGFRDPSRDVSRNSLKVLAAFRPVVEAGGKGTVRVYGDAQEVALGTVVGADGWVLTKASELKGQPSCRLRDGRRVMARVVGHHEAYDLALLKVEAVDLAAVEWHESQEAPVGCWVASPGLGEYPVAVGVVSVASREVRSYGPPSGRDVPSSSGYLGVVLDEREEGLAIGQVMPGSAADKAGLKKDDLVLSLNGQEVSDPAAFSALIQKHKPGEVVTVKVMRGDEEKSVQATLGKRPATANRMDIQNSMGGTLSERRTGFPKVLQHDTVLRPSECGGPLLDLDGKAVGVNIARAGRTESYAIPSEAIREVLPRLKSGELAPKVPFGREMLGAPREVE